MIKTFLTGWLIVVFFCSCSSQQNNIEITSPDKQIAVSFKLINNCPVYTVKLNNNEIISPSAMGFNLTGNIHLDRDFTIKNIETKSYDETWEQPWGESKYVRNNYNETVIELEQHADKPLKMNIYFRVFNDGVAFRYEIPEQHTIDSLIILNEKSEFSFTENHDAWWIPAYMDNRYEYLYKKSPINTLGTVHTPLTLETKSGICMAIHEADLTDFASMTLKYTEGSKLVCDLVPWMDGTKVKSKAPMKSPWRTIIIAKNAGELLTSNMVSNLNEPNKLTDLSYIKPAKYMGIWWGMHIGKYTFWESETQGATTKNAKMYIDFAAENNIKYLLIEGWNKGWTPQWYENAMHQFNFTDCADNFNILEVNKYAQTKGVELVGYHETGANLINYLSQLDTAFALYKSLGIHNIKIGQVGSRLNMKEWHHGQFGVQYYRKIMLKAAENKMCVNFHEPIKGTGEWRTYPNMMMREGARGQEYNAWSEGNPPEHSVIIPFTRMLSGAFDFTPGIFDLNIKERSSTRVHTTLAKQLAFYVTIYSPFQMLADLPENYEGHPAFKFLLDVPTDWEITKIVNSKIGDYLTTVRKDRHSDNWYLGSTTDENERNFEIQLDFLDKNTKYLAEVYADGTDCEFDKNPLPIDITQKEVDSESVINIRLAKGGGQAIRFTPIQYAEDKSIKK